MKRTILSIFCCLATALFSQAQNGFNKTTCGAEYTAALRSDSTLWLCGNNGNGQLGSATYLYTDTLIEAVPGSKWINLSTGALHTLAIAADSTLWGWGLNGNGQLGTGSYSTNTAPIQLNATQHWRSVSGGEAHTMAIRNDGTLWATGMNMYGQLGTGDTVQKNVLVQVGADNDWKTVVAGGVFTMAIKQDGSLWGWGYNGDGELGLGNTSVHVSPVRIGSASDWVMVAPGFEFTLAMKADGTIWSSGFNGNMELGRVTSGGSDSSFVRVNTDHDWKYVTAGSSFGFGIKQNGTLWAWGFGAYGQLGISPGVAAQEIAQVGIDTNWKMVAGASGLVAGGTVLGLHSAGIKNVGTGICTSGADYRGQLGNGTIIAAPSGQFAFDCSVGASATAITDITTKNSISIYPNPANNYLNIDGVIENTTYKIMNANGQVTQNGHLNRENNQINISELLRGIYFVIINDQNGSTNAFRFVKE